jgi:amino acid transporter
MARDVKSAQGFVKEKRNLLPNESFHATGSYADSSWKLYLLDWLFWLAIAIVILFVIVKYGFPFVAGIFEKILPANQSVQTKSKGQPDDSFNSGRALTAGILTATGYAIFSAILVFFFSLLSKANVIRSYDSSGIIILTILGLGVLVGILLFLFMNSKFGLNDGLVSGIVYVGFGVVMVPVASMIMVFLLQVVMRWY